jgi:hypothetical protein
LDKKPTKGRRLIISEFRKLAKWNEQHVDVRTNIDMTADRLRLNADDLEHRLEAARGAGSLGWLGALSVTAEELGEAFSVIKPEHFVHEKEKGRTVSALQQFIVSQFIGICERFIQNQLKYKGLDNEAA